MENKKQLTFSAILMFVGILFIVVAGGIFVSSTWKYLPETVKKLAMVILTTGLFAGSVFSEKKWNLKKTTTAFYYLGICFTGFTVFSFVHETLLNVCGSLILAMLGMSVPVVIRFLQRQHWIDSLFEMLLLDGIAACTCGLPMETAFHAAVLTACVVALLLALFVKYCNDYLPDEAGLQIGALTFFGIHCGLLLPALAFLLTDSKNFLFTVLPAILLTAAVTVLYTVYRSKLLRFFQSLALFYLNLSAVAFVLHNFGTELVYEYHEDIVFFMVFLLNLALMIIFDRTEMFWINGITAVFSSFLQTIVYFFNSCLWDGEKNAFYCAYSLCLVIALILWKVLRKKRMPWMPLCRYLGILLLAEGNIFLCYLNDNYSLYYGLSFWFVVFFLQVAFFCRNHKIPQALFRTFALICGLMSLLTEDPLLPTVFYAADGTTIIADFGFEYICVFLGLTIVLLGFIWYDYKKGVRVFQQISTCLLLAFMLLGNLIISELPNVLFLGISMLIMLVAASVWKQKTYAIASAITLTLVVLYLTRAFWLSIAWWVYLFAAGVGLVIFAIKRERDEKKAMA